MFQANASFVSGVIVSGRVSFGPMPAPTTLPCPGLLLHFHARWGSVTPTLEAEEALQCLTWCLV